MSVEEIAARAAYPKIEELGFEPADVEFVKEDGDMCLKFYICSPNGVGIEDCEAVSKAIDPIVEEADPTQGKPYCLCVSSWGDRPLKNDADFKRNLNLEVDVRLKKAINGKKKRFAGTLLAFDEEKITVLVQDTETVFEKENIDTVRPYF